MTTKSDINGDARDGDRVIAALDACADMRRPRGKGETGGGVDGVAVNGRTRKRDPIDRAVAVIEAEAARLNSGDLAAVEAVFASQALALDVIFSSFAKHAFTSEWSEDEFIRRALSGQWSGGDMHVALKAQVQCREMLKMLLSLRKADLSARREARIVKQTVENAETRT
jgi:hypothetical protein